MERNSQAAAITFAMLRFEQEGAHRYFSAEHPGAGFIGVDRYIFLPSWKSMPRADAIDLLANLPSPALVFPTTTRGIASLMLLDELTGERRAWGQKTLDNQLAGVNAMATELGLSGDSRVLLDVTDEIQIVSLDVVRYWSHRFGAPIGWSLGGLPNDERASAQLYLIASDGRGLPDQARRFHGQFRATCAVPVTTEPTPTE